MSKFFKFLLGCSIVLFLFIQFQRYFDLDFISILFYIIEIFILIFVLIMILIGIYKWMNNPKRSHKIVLWISSILLGLIIYKPFGLITDKMIYGENIMYAYEEGVASCSSSFSFKKNGIYIQESFCFGSRRNVGNYSITNDTIVLDTTKIKQFKYGVINRKDSILEMYLTHPKTAKDFENLGWGSLQIQKKIQQSISTKYKLNQLN
ncbi:MAG TPA: hypothetical protein VIG94_11570 [Faecalibacter sp.]